MEKESINKKSKRKTVKKKKVKLIILNDSSTTPSHGVRDKKKLIIINDSSTTPSLGVREKKKRTSSNSKSNTKNKTIKNKSVSVSSLSPQEKDLKIPSEKNISMKRLNEEYIDLTEKLSDIMTKQGEPFRARAYQKAQETIMSYPNDIQNPDDLKGLPNIGPTIMEKLNEYQNTGTLKILEREKNNPVNILADIYGIGPKKAKELVDKGITSISHLRERAPELLNETQIIGLKYYEDILKRIPRSEIVEYEKIFDSAFKSVITNIGESESDSKFEIVGSYRRGAQNSGDIDVIITSNNADVFKNFINKLISEKVIIEVLSRGTTKCLVITKLRDSNAIARRVDFLYTKPEEFPFSILYFTGSKIFNTVMRHQALTMGYTMNEHGLYKMENNKKGNKVDHVFKTEKDIFDYLNMVYKKPEERTDGRAVVIKSSNINLNSNPSNTIKLVEPEPKPLLNKTIKKVEKKEKKENKEKTEKKEKKEKVNKTVKKKDFVDENIQSFKKDGIKVLENLNESELTQMLNKANIMYRNFNPIMTDNEYDILEEYIENKYPSNKVVKEIGAPVEKNKAKLPYYMGSMDKIKPDTGILSSWTQKYKGPYVLSCKLDGVSGLYTTEGKEGPKLYTRGDGKVGQDVSYLIPYLRLPTEKGIVIRGEFIIPKNVFETKYKNSFANGRNLVSGIVNRINIDDKVKDINFVVYEVIKPELKPSAQMEFLSKLNVDFVNYKTVDSGNLTNELLSNLLTEWRKNYIYDIDGVIVTDDKIYPRKDGNPEHAFAFKMVLSDQIAEAKVLDVIWTPSKDGYLKPRVQIEPIQLGGVKIEYATGFNAAFIEQNKIGVGAVVEIIRSGDVIPHIRGVTSPAEHAKMPDVPYIWNDTHVDILLENIESDETVREKVIAGFFKGIGVDGLSSGNVSRIIEKGYDSIPKIIHMSKEDFLKVEGFKEKMATKLYDGIKDRLNNVSLLTLMSVSNILGRGISEKKIEPILQEIPDILTSKDSKETKISKVIKVKGMAKKTAELFVDNIPKFLEFLKECGLESKLEDKTLEKSEGIIDINHPLYKKTIVMTGFRDEKIKELLKSVGASLGSSVSKNTFIVLTKNKDDDSGKILEAHKLGITIMTPNEFLEKFFTNN